MIKREYYLNQLRLLKDQKVIKVITGIRRCGKSTLLELFREDLAKSGVKKAQIQAFNFEEEKNVELLDWRKLHQKIEQKLVPDAMNYIFLDEIQKVEHFEEAVDSLFVKENVDLYITGSNAFLLSGELATYLTGRYISIHVLPFSFAEYVEAYPEETNEERLFTQYINSSAFPEVINLTKIDAKLGQNYLADLYDTIVKKDIAERYEIRNLTEFLRVAKYVMSNIGSVVSARTVANVLAGGDTKVAHTTVMKYLEYMTQSYLVYPVSRYDIRGKKLLTTNDKYYVVDLGLRQMLMSGSLQSDVGHRLENVVYLELLKRNEGEIMVGKADENEVDFIVQKPGGERVYYQVAYHISSEEVLRRELAGFVKIRDNYPKILLTLDMIDEDYSGIQKKNLVRWLLEK
ncbi:ATP-binding protein [Candidatus Saccharibacteria bacterium]|nr:ATP-binding protein [Candidatus Saccharibacteria bacterium]